jgi:predicted dehydrogenase
MKILMVGLGAAGQRHVRNLRRRLGRELSLSAYRVRRDSRILAEDLQVEAHDGLEEKYGIQRFDDLDAALGESPDAVFVTNPSSEHMEIALRAARHGCHLFIEKPLATLEDHLEELAGEVERRRLVAVVGYQYRFHPGFERLRSLLGAGRPGRILGARVVAGEHLPSWHPYEDYRQSYAARADLGGGVLFTQIHELDYVYACFGMPRLVFASGGRFSGLEVDVEDVASLLLEFQGPTHVFPVHLHLDYLQRPPIRSCEVLGDDGRIVWDYYGLAVDDFRVDGTVDRYATPEFRRNDMFLAGIDHFLACLRGEETPQVGVREGAVSVRIALAARQSMATGLPVLLRRP